MPYPWQELEEAPIARVPTSEIKRSSWRTMRPVIDYDRCISCMTCWKFCPDVAIRIEKAPEGHKYDEVPVIDYDYCKGCGICANECPVKCITMEREEVGP